MINLADIDNIYDDSRIKSKKGVFVAIKGFSVDGHEYIANAINNGAKYIVVDENYTLSSEQIKLIEQKRIGVISVKDTNSYYNYLLNEFYERPLDTFKLIGVTGTDGKTTVAEMLYQILSKEHVSGYIGTNGIRCDEFTMENDFTTPLPDELFKAFGEFSKKKCEFVAIEATGERLGSNRLNGVEFDSSIFTNLSRDQLDLFGNMENYALAKARLLKQTKKEGISVINYDDEYKDVFINNSNSKIITYGTNNNADIYATDIKVDFDKLEYTLNGIYGTHKITTNLSGRFNVYNTLSIIPILIKYGYEIEKVISLINDLKPIEARQTIIECNQPFKVIVDYAHMANAVKNLVDFVRPYTKGRIIVVIGAGGSRDINRRTDMAKYCTDNVDFSYFTIEDARFEDPDYLLSSMVEGVESTNYELEVDRDLAIKKALLNARKDDTVLILGKGSEKYMKTKGELVERKSDIELSIDILNELMNK